MGQFTVVAPTVTATEVPFKVVVWKGDCDIEIENGPSPEPFTTKMLPGAMAPLPSACTMLVAEFMTLEMAGVAASSGPAAHTHKHTESKGLKQRFIWKIISTRGTPILRERFIIVMGDCL
jgi:hypothetical protein